MIMYSLLLSYKTPFLNNLTNPMKTVTKKFDVFTFDELSPKAKEKAIAHFEPMVTDYWYFSDNAIQPKRDLEAQGFKNVEVLYDLSYSQGSGACFTGSLDNDGLLKFLTHNKLTKKYPNLVKAINKVTIDIDIEIKHSGRYTHEYSTTIESNTSTQYETPLSGKLRDDYYAFLDYFDNRPINNDDIRIGWLIQTNKEIYKTLKDEYESISSPENIASYIEDESSGAPHLFLKDGTLFEQE